MSLCRTRLREFAEGVGERWSLPGRKFLYDALYGLLAGRSCIMAEMARALREPRALIHTEKRLSYHCTSVRHDDDQLRLDYLRRVAPLLRDRRHRTPTISVDHTDLQKRRAQSMPYLRHVRDGSRSTTDNPVLGPGYEAVTIEGVGDGARRIPLWLELFSRGDRDFIDQNTLDRRAIRTVAEHVPRSAIWVFDRGFSGSPTLQMLASTGIKHVVRMKLDPTRIIWVNNVKTRVAAAVDSVNNFGEPFRIRKVRKRRPDHEDPWRVHTGYITDVRLPAGPSPGGQRNKSRHRYSMVICTNNLGDQPLVLLTNMKITSQAQAQEVAHAYHERWGIEEAHRFLKESLHLEKLRTLTWTSIKRMALLVFLAYAFLALLIEEDKPEIAASLSSRFSFGKVPAYLFQRVLRQMEHLLDGMLLEPRVAA